jgi:arsenite transporter
VGLMSAVGPALVAGEAALWAILALVLTLNFGIQLAVWSALRRAGAGRTAPAMAIVAGNRNLALFLAALPPETVEALLLFVGCFQVPMYLTPLVMARLYRRDLRPV